MCERTNSKELMSIWSCDCTSSKHQSSILGIFIVSLISRNDIQSKCKYMCTTWDDTVSYLKKGTTVVQSSSHMITCIVHSINRSLPFFLLFSISFFTARKNKCQASSNHQALTDLLRWYFHRLHLHPSFTWLLQKRYPKWRHGRRWLLMPIIVLIYSVMKIVYSRWRKDINCQQPYHPFLSSIPWMTLIFNWAKKTYFPSHQALKTK